MRLRCHIYAAVEWQDPAARVNFVAINSYSIGVVGWLGRIGNHQWAAFSRKQQLTELVEFHCDQRARFFGRENLPNGELGTDIESSRRTSRLGLFLSDSRKLIVGLLFGEVGAPDELCRTGFELRIGKLLLSFLL